MSVEEPALETSAKVLVADDDPGMRSFLEKLLLGRGYEVLLVADGDAAVAELESGDVDVLVADVRMPGKGGQEILEIVREEHPEVAVILITAFPSDDAIIEAMRAGATRFLIKPFAAGELLRSVNAAADEVRSAAESGPLNVVSGARGWVELTAPSRHEYLERLEGFVELLYGTALSPGDKEDIKIAISEIVANAVEWGNKEDARRKVHVSYCLFPEEIVFKVEDEGRGFDPGDVPNPSEDPIAHVMARTDEGKRPGGYGLFITKKIMNKVIYNERGNAVIMSKKLH